MKFTEFKAWLVITGRVRVVLALMEELMQFYGLVKIFAILREIYTHRKLHLRQKESS